MILYMHNIGMYSECICRQLYVYYNTVQLSTYAHIKYYILQKHGYDYIHMCMYVCMYNIFSAYRFVSEL